MMRRRRVLLGAICGLGLGLGVLSAAPVLGGTTAVDLALGGFVRYDGAAGDDWSGAAVANAGDVNGDGYADMLVAARSADNNGRAASGSTYVIFGNATPTSHDLAALGTAGFRIDGAAAGDMSGYSVAGAGDVNGDGCDDLLIGAPWSDNRGRTDSGSSYVVFGSASPVGVDLGTPGAAWMRIDGAATGLESGWSVAGAGDVNADGFDDLLIGARHADNNGRTDSGSSYVVYGGVSLTNRDLASLGTTGYRIDGAATNAMSGWAVAGAGDVNADGRDDVLVGSPQSGYNSRPLSGSAYVVFGKASPATQDLATISAAQGFRIDGAAADDRLGHAVAGAGDVNADGRPDVLLGAEYVDNNGREASGSTYVVFGSSSPSRVDLSTLGTAGLRIDGAGAYDNSGHSVAGAGDVNADGYGDVLIGAPGARYNDRAGSGSAYVVYSSAATTTRDLADLGTGGFRIDGAATYDYLGVAVSGVGDTNRDHADDVLIGAFQANGMSRVNSGSSFLILGTPPPHVTPTPAATLVVKARKASRAVPKTRTVKLVKKITVGPGQSASITVKVKPKKTRKKVKVTTTATSVKVRTRRAPKGKVTVKITASGVGYTPVTWKRSWKVR